ncbi:hypothetical protein ABVK25_011732 [Lepraria finkii]|uniref:Uncharacterized protein n=1 Tax=Lepraria finkii TaxID=1340010 RepID=A0ABR4APG8_9LECA
MTSTGPDATSSTVIPPSSSTAPSPPLPPFPSPSCLPVSDGDFNVDYAIIAIGTFCTDFNQTVSAGSDPASQVFAGGPSIPSIRLTLSWNDTGSCPQKQFPAQNAGRDCNTIFHSIISGCPSQQIGGSFTWNCGYRYLGFDQGQPDVAPPPSSTEELSPTFTAASNPPSPTDNSSSTRSKCYTTATYTIKILKTSASPSGSADSASI